MNHLRLRSLLGASLLTLALFLHPVPFTASEEPKPDTPQSPAGLNTEARQLRKEVESLRLRIEQLEKALRTNAPNRHAGDPGGRDRLLAETQQILTHFHEAKANLWKQAHGKIRALRLQVAASLTDLQDRYTRSAMLDQALAIRDAIHCIRNPGRSVLKDTGLLRTGAEAGRVLFFRVTGANAGSLYGTDVYTSDSALAAAAVHAGVLKMGETGIVKVTTIPNHQGYVGSTRNGITSSNWSSYPGFRVEALGDEDQDLNDRDTGEDPTAEAPLAQAVIELRKMEAARDEALRAYTPDQPAQAKPAAPSAMPIEAAEQIARFTSASADIRKNARVQVSHLTRETIDRLAPIQDAHTRAARLDDAIAIRDLLRKLADNTDQP